MGHVLIECDKSQVDQIENAVQEMAEVSVERQILDGKRERDRTIVLKVSRGRLTAIYHCVLAVKLMKMGHTMENVGS